MLASNTNDANILQTNGSTRTTILVVDDDTTARLTISAMISNEDEYRVILDSGAAGARRLYQNLMREGS